MSIGNSSTPNLIEPGKGGQAAPDDACPETKATGSTVIPPASCCLVLDNHFHRPKPARRETPAGPTQTALHLFSHTLLFHYRCRCQPQAGPST